MAKNQGKEIVKNKPGATLCKDRTSPARLARPIFARLAIVKSAQGSSATPTLGAWASAWALLLPQPSSQATIKKKEGTCSRAGLAVGQPETKQAAFSGSCLLNV